MKVVAILISVLVAVNALTDEQQWEAFKIDFEKTYKSGREESIRFKIFQDNLKKIEAHNERYERGQSTYAMGVNQFTDLTKEEVHNLYTMPEFRFPENAEIFEAKNVASAEASVDWRKKGAVVDVLNQGPCGSCYAFSALGSLEGQRAIKHKVLEQLSEQEVLDCAEPYGPDGCSGGLMYQVWNYVKDHGISRSSEYNYQAIRLTCKNFTADREDVKVIGTKFIANNTEAFRQAVENVGPISISITGDEITGYAKGIYDNPKCPHLANHGVLIVGYGSENGTDYWIIKNSWGKKWGENGYIRIKRYEVGVCGIYDEGMFPVIE